MDSERDRRTSRDLEPEEYRSERERDERDVDAREHRHRDDRDLDRDDRDRDRDDRERDRDTRDDRDRDRSRSPTPERYHRSYDDRERERDRGRSHSRSLSRSRSPRHRRDSHSHSHHRDREHREHRDHHHSRDRDRDDRDRDRYRSGSGRPARSPQAQARFGRRPSHASGGAMNAPAEEAEAHARVSKRENRIYVGNLSYDCNYRDLRKFMMGAGGDVVFSEILVTPAGTSKGCGIVEFATTDQARRAKSELADKQFMGRAVFIREDREEVARFGQPPIPGRMGMARGEGFGGGGVPNRNVFVANIPLQASWQDLKDLMRGAGEVIRADIGMTPDGRPKGNGTVVFVDPEGAQNAIRTFNGYDWYGSILEVREDRFANMPGRGGRGGFRGGFPRGGFVGRGGFAPRGGFGGGGGGFGPPGQGAGYGPPPGGFMNGGAGGYGNGAGVGANAPAYAPPPVAEYDAPPATPAKSGLRPEPAEPSQQIWVRNLPWSTTNEDLVELFETVGPVVLAEILFEGEQSRGEGIVQFTETPLAQAAGDRFSGYVYGGRPLDVQFNPRWHEFGTTAARGGEVEIEA